MVLYSLDNDKAAKESNLISRPNYYWKIEAGLQADFGYNFERTMLTSTELEEWKRLYPKEQPAVQECIYAMGNTPKEALDKIIRLRLENGMYLGDL